MSNAPLYGHFREVPFWWDDVPPFTRVHSLSGNVDVAIIGGAFDRSSFLTMPFYGGDPRFLLPIAVRHGHERTDLRFEEVSQGEGARSYGRG